MKKHFIYLIISTCFYLSVSGQEHPSNGIAVLNQRSIHKIGSQPHQPTNTVGLQNLKAKHGYKEKLDSIIEYNYHEETDSWSKKLSKEAYTYDEDLNEILWIYSAWNADDQHWENLLKEESEYDGQTNMTLNTSYIWSNNQWNKDRKTEYTYNQNNERIQTISYKWKYNLNDWLLTEKWDHSYDSRGEYLADSLSWWNANLKVWDLKEKIDYRYINNKELHYIFYSNWDANTNEWVMSKKDWYLYDLQWRLINLSNYEWNDSTEDNWKLTNRKGYSYDDADYLKKYVNVAIRPRKEDGSLQHQMISENYTFDFSVAFNELRLPNYSNYNELHFHHKLLSKKQSLFDYDSEKYEQYRDVKFYYSPVVLTGTGSQGALSANITICPIPAKEYLSIEFQDGYQQASIAIYTINGTKLLDKVVRNKTRLDISDTQSGVYFYKLMVGDEMKTGKLIID